MRQWGWRCLVCRYVYRGDVLGHPYDRWLARDPHALQMRPVQMTEEEAARGVRGKRVQVCPECDSGEWRPLGRHERC